MGIVNITKKNKLIINITAFLTVITLFVYLLAFSLPHDLHCSENSDDCPICNLSYFNALCFDGQLTNNIILQETNEKPILLEIAGFSYFSYFKFFLRSPPSYTA